MAQPTVWCWPWPTRPQRITLSVADDYTAYAACGAAGGEPFSELDDQALSVTARQAGQPARVPVLGVHVRVDEPGADDVPGEIHAYRRVVRQLGQVGADGFDRVAADQ